MQRLVLLVNLEEGIREGVSKQIVVRREFCEESKNRCDLQLRFFNLILFLDIDLFVYRVIFIIDYQ